MIVQFLFHITLLLWSMSASVVLVVASDAPIAKPNCQSHCGGIEIPFPFGIGAGCYINDDWFQIVCDNSTGYPRPFLNGTNVEVLEISVEGTLKVSNPITFHNCSNKTAREAINLDGSPFMFSQNNIFTAVGCGVMATITSNSNGVTVSAGCRSECYDSFTKNSSSHTTCDGVDCCQTVIPPYLYAFNTSFLPADDNYTKSSCSYAFLVDGFWFESFVKNSTNISATSDMDQVPVDLWWNLYHSTIDVFGTVMETNGTYADNADVTSGSCYIYNDSSSSYESSRLGCTCGGGFEGNPYLLGGCRDINECEDPKKNTCSAGSTCYNIFHGYRCDAPRTKSLSKQPVKIIFIGIGSGFGLILLLMGAWWLHKFWKKMKAIKLKKKFFKQNGGLLLEQQLSSGEVNVEKIKLFNSKELDKATDHYNVDRILGQGGQGTVYKGMLTDGRIVAVKKSKLVDASDVGQFINEIVILSQINHRNVVKLLGCCLETEVPLLVYEFIPKGTIYQYLHEQNEDFLFTWEIRLRISAEVAAALAYLHSAAGFPIYHRDIKSTNILLDDKYRAKVADFGTSRSVSIDQTHLTTMVHGTFGYLDPEYFQSSQFTDKSDVYSFGVVLVELLTGEKPVSLTRSQEARGLVSYFNESVEENNLLDIIDARVKEDGVTADILAVANLAQRCLAMNGKRRPTMKEVAIELEVIHNTVKSSNMQTPEEMEYVRNEVTSPWDVVSTLTGLALPCGTASSVDSQPLLSDTSH